MYSVCEYIKLKTLPICIISCKIHKIRYVYDQQENGGDFESWSL